jgi:hypothetical protein
MKSLYVVLLACVLLVGCGGSNLVDGKGKPYKKYRFEPIHLPDGTPCYVVKGGTHSGYIGITCDYVR